MAWFKFFRLTEALIAVSLFGLVLPVQAQDEVHSDKKSCALVIHVLDFRNQKGDLGVTVFTSPDGWPEKNDKSYFHASFPISGQQATAQIHLPPGRYAIAVIHDENSNHKLDRNLFGIPKEGFGFVNNPKVAFSAPDFNTASIEVACPKTETTIHLIYK
jgi:uncharacterized protein (DUF2141 family)